MTAPPAASPFGAATANPATPEKTDGSYASIGRPPKMGVTSVVNTFIWTMPPGGAVSFAIRTESESVVSAASVTARVRMPAARKSDPLRDIGTPLPRCESKPLDARLGDERVACTEGLDLPEQRLGRHDLSAHRQRQHHRRVARVDRPQLVTIDFHQTDVV